MKIAGMGYNSKRVSLLNPYLRIYAESYDPKRAYTRGLSDKILYEKVMPCISIYGTTIDGRSKKINGKWVFPNARKLTAEAEDFITKAEDFITKKENEIERLRQEISSYLNEHFLEWDFVTIEEAVNFRKPNQDNEAEQKYQAHVRNVIRQLDMTKEKLRKEEK